WCIGLQDYTLHAHEGRAGGDEQRPLGCGGCFQNVQANAGGRPGAPANVLMLSCTRHKVLALHLIVGDTGVLDFPRLDFHEQKEESGFLARPPLAGMTEYAGIPWFVILARTRRSATEPS